jgi:2-keto-4-pentenoate hydratase/2-oxohepta-3-ene-1,7-dioic acid hydratase in catechol pathway
VKLARFEVDGARRFGVVHDAAVIAVDHRVPSFEALVADPDRGKPAPADPRWPAEAVSWLPPFTETAKIICVGFNYGAHAREAARHPAAYPTLFIRFPDSFVGSGQAAVQPEDALQLDWEGEVALIIGSQARRVPAADASAHIAGFTCMAENSERGWQQHTGQATAGKNWTASGACGPWITTADEVAGRPLRIVTRLNGDVVQDDTTEHLLHPFTELISYISTFTELRPGDVIATGTPAGTGFRRDPPRFLKPGDELEVAVPGVGVLRHHVIDEPSARAVPGGHVRPVTVAS